MCISIVIHGLYNGMYSVYGNVYRWYMILSSKGWCILLFTIMHNVSY